MINLYLEEAEGVGDAELDLLSVHSWRIVDMELHQILCLIDGAQLHKCLEQHKSCINSTGHSPRESEEA